MLRAVVIASFVAALVAAAAASAQQDLLPGLQYDREVQFTPHGPVAIDVLTGPRPGGLWSLRPVLSNETIQGTEKLTAIEQRLATSAVVAGIGGDFFDARTGIPTGLLMRGGVLDHPPVRERSSAGIDGSGNLAISRVQLISTWQGGGQREPFNVLNDVLPGNGVALYTPAWGPATPATAGTLSAVIEPFPGLRPGATPAGPVTQVVQDAPATIPPDGAVLVAHGAGAVAALRAEAPVGQTVTFRPVLKPDWSGIPDAVGGGPVLVRNGRGVFRANEAFTTDQLLARSARAAVGQLKDGRIVLVAVAAGRPGFSTGMSNFDLALTMVRLGAVNAMALSPGDAAAMAFQGQLLSVPSNPAGEQPIADALLFEYAGVYAPPPSDAVLSPNGDGVAEKEELSYTVTRPSTVTATLVGPDGAPRSSASGAVQPGTYPLEFTGLRPDGSPDVEGTYRWVVNAADDLGRQSTIERDFTLNETLAGARASGPTLTVPRAAPRVVATVNVAHPALVTLRIETPAGVLLRNLGQTQVAPGPLDISWDGVTDSGAVVYSGRYVARASAQNTLGTVDLTATFQVRRVAGHG